MALLSSLSVVQNQLHFVIIMASVISMNHATVLIVMIKLTIVLSMHKENNSSVPKIRWRNVILINSHTVSQHVLMGIPVMRVVSVSLLQPQLDCLVLFVDSSVQLVPIVPPLLVMQMKREHEGAVRVLVTVTVGRVSQLSEVKLQHDLLQLPMMDGHVKMVEQEFKWKLLLSVVQVQVLLQQQ